MNYIIREMNESDIDGVYELEKLCFPKPWTKKMLSDELIKGESHYIVCVSDDNIIGYAGCLCMPDGADITNVAVSPKFRRNGIAIELLENISNEIKRRNLKQIMLEVRKSNIAARTLYEKLGFSQISIRRRYYSDNGEDAIIMIKEW